MINKQRRGEGKVVIDTVNKVNTKEKYERSEASRIQHSYPLKFLIPEYASETNCRWVYPITYGGGLVSGDDIDIEIHIKPNCAAVVTSQESTKVFKCENEDITQQISKYQVGDGSLLCVLTDPVVCFQDADFLQSQVVRMSSKGNLVLLDMISAGRIARGERWQFKGFKNHQSIYIDDEHVLNEVNHLQNTPWLSLQKSLGDAELIGTCIVIGDGVENLTASLCKKYGQPKQLGEKYDKDAIYSVSKLEYTINTRTVSGCYLRFVTSTNKAYEVVDDIVKQLIPIIGSDPYSNKH